MPWIKREGGCTTCDSADFWTTGQWKLPGSVGSDLIGYQEKTIHPKFSKSLGESSVLPNTAAASFYLWRESAHASITFPWTINSTPRMEKLPIILPWTTQRQDHHVLVPPLGGKFHTFLWILCPLRPVCTKVKYSVCKLPAIIFKHSGGGEKKCVSTSATVLRWRASNQRLTATRRRTRTEEVGWEDAEWDQQGALPHLLHIYYSAGGQRSDPPPEPWSIPSWAAAWEEDTRVSWPGESLPQWVASQFAIEQKEDDSARRLRPTCPCRWSLLLQVLTLLMGTPAEALWAGHPRRGVHRWRRRHCRYFAVMFSITWLFVN